MSVKNNSELLESIKEQIMDFKNISQVDNDYFNNFVLNTNSTLRRNITGGYLFWEILKYSFYYNATYDYSTIIKLYIKHGIDAMDCEKILTNEIYSNFFDKEKKTLSEYGFNYISYLVEIEVFLNSFLKSGIVERGSTEYFTKLKEIISKFFEDPERGFIKIN